MSTSSTPPAVNVDLQIAQSAEIRHIRGIAEKIGIREDDLEYYGKYKAKLPLSLIDESRIPNNHLVLVTAISPTPAGEGKTTMSIGLTDGLNEIGKQAMVVLREPSLGPVFGIKGGAAGGGYSQVIPMVDINLHFTGDFSAIEKANNLLSALIDNALHHRNKPVDINPTSILWKRVMDMNDRALRHIVVGLGGATNGVPREDGFNITVASEVMAIVCLSRDFQDLKRRLGNIFVGYTYSGEPVYARDLKAEGPMALLLKDAIKPNLVQTLEGNPAIIHCGPFANIAQGTNSLIATKMGLSLSEYVVTEAGFGADLGAEKFLDIKCPAGNLKPEAIVLVATIRALRHHGGAKKAEYNTPNLAIVEKGFPNLTKHIENCLKFGIRPVVAINHFPTDTPEEIAFVQKACAELGIDAVLSKGWAEGGKGMSDLARAVVKVVEEGKSAYRQLYSWDLSIEDKIETIAREIYGADGVDYTAKAKTQLKGFSKLGFDKFPVCMAKTQKSFSDDERKVGRPTGFRITVREFEVAAGAGFVIPILGEMMRMPGLPAIPAAEGMDIFDDGTIVGLS